jgi:Tol biopolymer transport system component
MRLLVAALVALVAAAPAGAQSYFGMNQVQFDHFDWKVLETDHFLIHYYPQEEAAVQDAARMAERAYARLSRMLDHQFREKKPLILFASRTDFGQNNVLGDLGEGTGGVTEALRQRMLLPFTGDWRSFEHVLTHEMVHAFQYDIFARGRAGQGLQTLQQVGPPLWFMEGMAEYLSAGPQHRFTEAWVRDAALNGSLPSIEQMTERPDRYFPYRYGESVWEYIGSRWGDDVIGQIMNALPNVGIERAFKRELGLSLEDLSEEWKDAMQVKHLPQIANLERARRFSQPLLTERRTGGEIFLAPALSDDGSRVAFLSTGSFLRGEVFIDLWLADGQTGKRIGRLVKSTTDPNFEELRLLYSQSSFSPDGRTLAFTAQRAGKDVLYLLDVRRRKVSKRFDLPLEGILSPSWSPDGRRIVFTGNDGGITDLYVVDADGRNFRQLTDDVWGDLQPSWSPDGRTIAFASERGPQADYDLLRYGKWRISTLDLETGLITVLPGQAGMNINPVWAPDGRSLIFVTDRTGIQNLFLYDLDDREHYQLTNVVGAVTAATEYSPAITWAKKADRLAYTYYEDGEWTVWSINNPRALKKTPYRDSLPAGPALVAEAAPELGIARPVADTVVVAGLQAVTDSTPGRTSLYRSDDGFRRTDDLPEGAGAAVRGTISVAALLDSAALALPDTSQFKRYDYKIRFQPDYIARPSIGYAQDNWGRGVFGGTTIILSDMLGNNRLALSGEVNGRISEARYLAAYTNLSRRLQWVAGIYQTPLYLISDIEYVPEEGLCPGCLTEYQDLTRYIVRQAFGTAIYPFNRFTRLEGGARFMNIDRAVLTFYRGTTDVGIPLTPVYILGQRNASSINYVQPYVAWVSDNTLNGYTGPIFGRRFRFEVQPTVGTYQWVEYLADYRRYDPILFNFLTFSTRVMASLQVGPDGDSLPKYIGNSQYVRGYDRENYYGYSCGGGIVGSGEGCDVRQLLGSRVALANAELRFPLIRRFELGVLPIALPPLDGLVFYDIGVAWNSWNDVRLRRPEGDFDPELIRYPLRSWGAGLRLNLFGLAIVRWDYAIPLDGPERKGFWTWSLGPSF